MSCNRVNLQYRTHPVYTSAMIKKCRDGYEMRVSLDISRVEVVASLGDVRFTSEVCEPHKRRGLADRIDS
jgi:hypothetical protein